MSACQAIDCCEESFWPTGVLSCGSVFVEVPIDSEGDGMVFGNPDADIIFGNPDADIVFGNPLNGS